MGIKEKKKMMKNSIDNNRKSTPFPKEQLLKDIKEFLEIQSKGLSFADRYKESMTSQPYFTATNEQLKDSNWKPDITVGLEDSSYIIFPTGKVGQTVANGTKGVSPIIQKGGQIYDDVTLGAIQGMNKIAPDLIGKYIINPNNSLKIIGGIEIGNDIFK